MQPRIDLVFAQHNSKGDNNKINVPNLVVDIQGDGEGVRWARSCTGPVVHRDAENLVCYDCKETLSFVKAHESSRNGIKHRVGSFYRHGPRIHTRPRCCPESILHKAAKHAICSFGSKWRFFRACSECHGNIPITVSNNESDAFEEEVRWGKGGWYLDVAIKHAGEVVAAVEVYVTHLSKREKIQEFTASGIAWCEVSAARVLEAVEKETFDVKVLNCAVDICDTCIEKLEQQGIAQFHSELERATADAAELRCKRRRIIDGARLACQQVAPPEAHEDEEEKWLSLTRWVHSQVVGKANELGLCTDEALAHVDKLLEGETVLQFGKYKGRTLAFVAENHWPYLLWLAGYQFGKMDYNGRAAPRVAGNGANFIPRSIEIEAEQRVQGLCFECQDEITDFQMCPWKTWCRNCYAKLRNDLV